MQASIRRCRCSCRSSCTGNRIDPANRAIRIPHMVGKPVVMMETVEIGQDEETAEIQSSPPEWPWHPIIKIGIVPGRRIISHDRRSVIVIVFAKFRGIHIFGSRRRGNGGTCLVPGA